MSKITRAKRTRGVAQLVEYLLCKKQRPEFKLHRTEKKKKQLELFSQVWWYMLLIPPPGRLIQEY
jgi:hypothetical protein